MDTIKEIANITWLIVSNSWILAFIITGIIMRLSYRYFDIWYGRKGGAVLYAVVAFILNSII